MQDDERKEVTTSTQEDKPVWRVPELTVISMDQTKTGTFSIANFEGAFYQTS
ncbi:hypothetical protein [Arenicella xantha]|uniref:Uncharacterized protein n=1 Tax=Arenicella xantha TaxID=644221 RepID=A0A395JIS0_9GAMM|nr:hypothetical protein [Arenicella xantha]RBP49935.1 hypothetical protein DFR28_103367 [Arenicella xantha]